MMARSFSGAKIMSGLVLDGFFNALIRRGYTAGATAAAQRVASGTAAEEVPTKSFGMTKKEEKEIRSIEKMAWMPDPVTGYYRPENYADEIDAVDLRAMLLKPRTNVKENEIS